ncbi:acetylglutamate kinase [Halobacillus fulvus]|nr:acetylglutamate kinase [Halobacillus fulvus]
MQVTERKEKPTIVIKLGGSMVEQLSDSFYQSFTKLLDHYKCLIVHGGGPAITSLMDRLQIEGEFYNGLRKTTKEALEVVEMTLGGKVNAQITSRLAEQQVKAIGLKGSDASMITATYIDQPNLGFVGEVHEVDTGLLQTVLADGYIPVIAPLGKTADGQTVNINADSAAAAVAKAVEAKKLLFVTDVPGILYNDEVLEETTPGEIDSFIERGHIYGGMIPKVQSAVSVLSDHLQEVMIVSGAQPLIQGEQMNGTAIRAKRKEGVE